ncbi:hypothetical protein FSHL1_008564 [Fusarium sambucinum]
MRAFVTDGKGSGSIQNVPRPSPSSGDILIKVHHVALNPGDWKLVEGDVLDGPAAPGLIVGCDFAGIVEEPNGSKWQKGQRVGGWVHGATYKGIGAFAEFISIEPTLVFTIPDNVTFQQGAAISLAFATATQAMFQRMELPEPYWPNESQFDFLVYGASTSVGLYAVQLGRLSGLRVIAIASTKNHDLLKRLGADITFDYHDEDWVDSVKDITNGKLKYAFDTIADGISSVKMANALRRSDGAHLVALSPVNRSTIESINPYVKAESIIAFTVFGRALGEDYAMFDNAGAATPGDKHAWENYLQLVTHMLKTKDLQPNPVREVGSLDNVIEAFRLSKEGKLSAEKAVLSVVGGN